MTKFIGRQEELKKLLDLSKKKSASFIVVRGRRRIGKSRLVDFGQKGLQLRARAREHALARSICSLRHFS